MRFPHPLVALLALLAAVGFPRIAHAQTTVVYDNLASSVLTGFSSADGNGVWGDRVSTTATGRLTSLGFTLFNGNSGGNANPILTTDVILRVYDASTFNPGSFLSNTPLLTVSTPVNLGAGLLPGTGTSVTVDVSSLNFFLPTRDLVLTQQLAGTTGGSTSTGVLFHAADTVGTQYLGNDNFFMSNNGFGSGYFTLGTDTNRMGYRVGIAAASAPEPGTLALIALGIAAGVVARRRR